MMSRGDRLRDTYKRPESGKEQSDGVLRPERDNFLKLIACLTMLIDHIAAVFYDTAGGSLWFSWNLYYWMRLIGRSAFPIFAYQLAVGLFNTRSIGRYCLRLFLFAIVAQIPFSLAFNAEMFALIGNTFDFNTAKSVFIASLTGYPGLNVIVTMLLAALPFLIIGRLPKNTAGKICAAFLMITAAITAALLGTDYGAMGVFLIYAFFTAGNSLKNSLINVIFFFFIWIFFYGYDMGIFCIPALLLIYLPAVLKKPELYPRIRLPRYFFYVFYPAHMLIIALIAAII